MKATFYFIKVILIGLILTPKLSGQTPSKKVRVHLQEEEKTLKAQFPLPLLVDYPRGSLGEKFQSLYEAQAKSSCLIERQDKRLYIPKEIINGYEDSRLRSTLIYDIPVSASNLLFLVLTPSDITKINNNTFIEQEYLAAKRIIGINDNLLNYGQSGLSPISGFPSLFYQKSCGSYFDGDVTTKVKAPVAELEASLRAETKKSSTITTITGKFFSPLYIIFAKSDPQSVYAHLLLWEIYAEHYKNSIDKKDLLAYNGKYISEFNATINNRANDSEQSFSMNGRLSAGISAGIFSINGNIKAGYENRVSFSLKDFNTSIHKLPNGNLSYALTDLPRIKEINQKLPNCLFKPQFSINGFVTHLFPTEFTRILSGIPSSLCSTTSWYVGDTDFDKDIWRDKPKVTSIFKDNNKDGEYPECICKISGYINKAVIDQAIIDKGTIDLNITITNTSEINNNRLKLDINEPSVKVTDDPKIQPISSDIINAERLQKGEQKLTYIYTIPITINATHIRLMEPYNITNAQIEYVNKDYSKESIKLNEDIYNNGNQVRFEIRTIELSKSSTHEIIELSVPIKIKFSIELVNGQKTQLVTNIINLKVPSLVEKPDIKTKIEPEPILRTDIK